MVDPSTRPATGHAFRVERACGPSGTRSTACPMAARFRNGSDRQGVGASELLALVEAFERRTGGGRRSRVQAAPG
jgi:hypothetical protein